MRPGLNGSTLLLTNEIVLPGETSFASTDTEVGPLQGSSTSPHATLRITRAKKEDILHKCLILITLATGNRGSEIASFVREGLTPQQDGSLRIAVKQGFLYENQTIDRNPPPVVIQALPRNQLCPVANLKSYLELSTATQGHLFLHPLTELPLNRSHIAMRICTLIKEADPTGIPQMHDLRRAAASIAWTRGIPPAQIVKSAFWSRADTFIRRYLRKCPNVRCIALGTRS